MYTVNIEPHTPGPKGSVYEFPIDIDEHYVSDMADRAMVLRDDPLRCQSLPHMLTAEWDLVELLMTSMAHDYPEHFSLTRDGDNFLVRHRLRVIAEQFSAASDRDRFRLLVRTIRYAHGAPLEPESR